MDREARLICWAPKVLMLKQSRQHLKFQALLAERAHFMRHDLTETESPLWRKLSGKQLGFAFTAPCGRSSLTRGPSTFVESSTPLKIPLRFKRQIPIDRYIVDVLASAERLVVEVDGAQHSLRRTADARRDRTLQRLGYRVLRIDAELVRCNLAEAVARILAAPRELA